MHFGARQTERLRDHRDRRLRHVTERFLQRMQDDQRGAFHLACSAMMSAPRASSQGSYPVVISASRDQVSSTPYM